MKKLTIEDKLIEIENKLTPYKTPKLRAEILLDLLKVERENLKNIDLLNSRQDLQSMLTEMNKSSLKDDIDIAIKLLSNYMQTDSITISFGSPNPINTKRFNELKENLMFIINKNDNEGQANFFE